MSDLRQTADPHREATFTLGNRARRALWGIVYAFLFWPSPRPCHRWRAFLLTTFGARLGQNCHIYSKVRIWAPWNLELGDEVGVADGAILYSMAKISVGRRAVISQGAHLCTGTHDFESRTFQLYAEPIRIGGEAWICADAFLAPGVEVGEGAVIGARSVVTKDMPAWQVCAGNPCRPLRQREYRD